MHFHSLIIYCSSAEKNLIYFPFLYFKLKGTCTQSSCTRQYHFRYCRQNYTDLATIENMEEMDRLIKRVRRTYYGKAWIGLYDDINSWRWSLDNVMFDGGFKGWFVQQQVNSGGQSLCVYMSYYRGTWSEASCYYTLPFVCYDEQHTVLHFTVLINFDEY
uniref:C-type lectin domain-containing protein n=1 Tax=Cyprinus carpio TaxID=7962 RepID=A0A8C1ZVZ8_CYPCA